MKKSEIKKMIKENILSELKTQTYADIMNTTDSHPWTSFIGNTDKGTKQGRVNTLAKQRFISEFYREFPLNDSKLFIESGNGNFIFNGIKFEANHTMYILIFKLDNKNRYLYISGTSNKFHIDKNINDMNLVNDKRTESMIKNMLRYNQ